MNKAAREITKAVEVHMHVKLISACVKESASFVSNIAFSGHKSIRGESERHALSMFLSLIKKRPQQYIKFYICYKSTCI
jgi:hypothetical protein